MMIMVIRKWRWLGILLTILLVFSKLHISVEASGWGTIGERERRDEGGIASDTVPLEPVAMISGRDTSELEENLGTFGGLSGGDTGIGYILSKLTPDIKETAEQLRFAKKYHFQKAISRYSFNLANQQRIAASFSGVSLIANGYVVIQDGGDLINDNMKQRSSTGRAVERSLLFADGTIATIGVCTAGKAIITVLAGGTLAATPIGWGMVAVAAVVGVTTAFVHSEEGAAYMEEWGKGWDKWFSEAFDSSRKKAKRWWSDFWDWWEGDTAFEVSVTAPLVRQPYGTGAYKPNIYIYANAPVEVTLVFDAPYLLTRVIPDYEGGWNVTAEGNGTLTLADGSTLEYLFYESETQAFYFQTEEGFYIPAENRAQAYEEILSDYGFNDQEIADFVDFWVEKLPSGVDYIMYPQNTETVDRAMPLEIDPAPKHLERLWFAFEAYHGQNYTEADAERFVRDGYTVIEWGGVILDEHSAAFRH